MENEIDSFWNFCDEEFEKFSEQQFVALGEVPKLTGPKVFGAIELSSARKTHAKGEVVKVTISKIVDYGAFAQFDDVSGLIYLDEIVPVVRYGEVDKVLSVGQEVDCVVKEVKQKGKISLTMRGATKPVVYSPNTKSSEQSLNIKSIWKAHIDVQEQLLRKRSTPISVCSTSVRVAGEKLYLDVHESCKPQKFLFEIANFFNVDKKELQISDGCLMIDKVKSMSVSKSERQKLSEIAQENFIKFSSYPIVDGMVFKSSSSLEDILKSNNCNYSFSRKDRLQISISDIKRLEEKFEEASIRIQDTATTIFHFSASPLWSLTTLFPNIKWQCKSYYFENERDECKIVSIQTIEVKNGFLSEDVLRILSGHHLKLFLYRYCFVFHVNPAAMHMCKPSHGLPEIGEDGCSFIFDTRLGKVQNESKEDSEIVDDGIDENFDFNFKFTRLKRTFCNIFGADNVTCESSFEYCYDIKEFNTSLCTNEIDEKLWCTIKNCFKDEEHVSLSRSNLNVGIDFNWKEYTLKDILERVSLLCPYVTLSYFDNHRCNVDLLIDNATLADIEHDLKNSFPSITLCNNPKTGTLYFSQEYSDCAKRNQIERSIRDELAHVCSSLGYSFEIYSVPDNKDKYYLKVDSDSLQESLSEQIENLRGCDFFIGENISIGKLLRIDFPQLTFDISSIDNKEEIKKRSDNHLICWVKPDLKGDIEKIKRLKTSFSAISSGKNLSNPNLSEFIFDATKAAPIVDIEYYVNPQGDYYKEIESHLLNSRVNESQKQAIVKCLLAKDLAIIQGPPGTGKSTAIAEIMWQHVRKNKNERILLTSETNLAVDNAIARMVNANNNLVKPVRFGGEDKLEMEGKQFNIDTLKAWVAKSGLSCSDEVLEDEDVINNERIGQKTILDNWLANIARRVDANQMGGACSIWLNILQNPPEMIRQKVYDNYIRNCNVVGATCSSIGEKNANGHSTAFFRTYRELFGKREVKEMGRVFYRCRKIEFSTIIQDESSKATPAELSLPLIYGKKNIIIGDHRQLPPLLDKEDFLSSMQFLLNNNVSGEAEKREIKKLKYFVQQHFNEIEVSHFQRLFESIDCSLKGVFNQQYRMHPAINEVIKQFYVDDGGLFCGLDSSQVDDPDMSNPQSRYHGLNIDGFISPETHVVWIDTNTPEMLVGTSRVNYGEVEAIQKVLEKFQQSESFKLYQNFWSDEEDKQIGLISFYGKQLKLLKGLRSDFPDIPLRVSTVDRFQGMERNIIIVSMVRSHIIATDKNQLADYELYPELGFYPQTDLGFAQSPNRLNVALSRAKRLLIVVGNSRLFRQKKIYENVYTSIANSPNGKILNAEEL